MAVKIMTNNPLVRERLSKWVTVDYRPSTLMDFLTWVRDSVHEGTRLLTHPLSGSIKPGETPYKSILVESGDELQTDMTSVTLIESALETTDKFIRHSNFKQTGLPEKVLEDFQLIDLTLIISALPSAGISVEGALL